MLGLRLEDSRILREAKAEGGREKALTIVVRQLTRRVGILDDALQTQIGQLSDAQLEDLSEALLDFETLVDLVAWLERHPANQNGNAE